MLKRIAVDAVQAMEGWFATTASLNALMDLPCLRLAKTRDAAFALIAPILYRQNQNLPLIQHPAAMGQSKSPPTLIAPGPSAQKAGGYRSIHPIWMEAAAGQYPLMLK